MDNKGLYCHKCFTGGQLCTPPGVENECRNNTFLFHGFFIGLIVLVVIIIAVVNVLSNMKNPFSRREPWQDLVDETDNYEDSLKS